MTDKNPKPQSDDTGEAQVPAVEVPGRAEQLELEIDTLKAQLEEANAKAKENLDGWQRAQAEFVNYKSRLARDQETQRVLMKGDIFKRVLPILDDLERALANVPEGDPWASGLELIVRKFQSILESEGLKRIDAKGQPFDPNFHEAISHEPVDGVKSGHVIEVVQNGYTLGDRVIRPAMVRVAQ